MNFTPTSSQLEALTGASTLASVPETQAVYGMPDPDYRLIGAISQTALRAMDPMPGHIERFFSYKPSRDCILGNFIHEPILIPNAPRRYAVKPATYPSENKKTKVMEQKKWTRNATFCDEWETEMEAEGLTVISKDEHETIEMSVASVLDNKDAFALLQGTEREVSLFQVVRDYAVPFRRKTRIDFANGKSGYLGDIKTVQRGKGVEGEFVKVIRFDGAAFQAAWELEIWNACNPDQQCDRFCWIVVEKEAPYATYTYHTSLAALSYYTGQIREKLAKFAECVANNGVFPGDQGFKEIAI